MPTFIKILTGILYTAEVAGILLGILVAFGLGFLFTGNFGIFLLIVI